MGTVLEHELVARYAAGSLGGTLGRLGESLRRLSRACATGSRDQPGEADRRGLFIETARLARLTQTLRAMADDWQSGASVVPWFGVLEDTLDRLKEETMLKFSPSRGGRPDQRFKYQMLAQALESLQSGPAFAPGRFRQN